MRSFLFAFLLFASSVSAYAAVENSHYQQTNLIANHARYKPTVAVDKKLINAWGVAIRPAGAGGHFWVGGKNISFEYVGDVHASSDEKIRKLHTDDLKYVTVPTGNDEAMTTGVVFSGSSKDFVVTQNITNADVVTAPAKFIFASDGGIISAWTERKKADGTFDRADEAIAVIDQSKDGAQFFGVAFNKNYDRMYVADFGAAPALKVFDGEFKPANVMFEMPFDENKNGKVDAGEYAPFNVQTFGNSVFVAYAKTQTCPKEEVAKKTCGNDELFVGEEDTRKAGYGRLAEFDEEGKLMAVWNDGGKLAAPWGLAFAPENFGVLSGALLVANFGDGTIAGYDKKTREFIDVMRDAKGKAIVIDKIWGLQFGNGSSLGDANALYFSAGPRDEQDGIFGSLRVVE